MAQKMKKALSLLLAVIMAFSCYAVLGYAYTGYDNDGSNNALKVQTVLSADATEYSAGDTVSVTVTLNHINDSIIGYEGVIAYDSSVLEYTGATLADGFEYYDTDFEPSPIDVDPSTLTQGYGGKAVSLETLCTMMGTPDFGAVSAVPLKVLNTAGVAAGSGTAVATLTFTANGSSDGTKISLIPSVIYGSDYGFYNCAATTSTDGIYETAYSAIRATDAFTVTGGTTSVYYDITFTWYGGSKTVSTLKGQVPEVPAELVKEYSDGDYDYVFAGWNKDLVAATGATTYVAQYDSTFVSADFTSYNAAKEAAVAKRDNGTNWTEDSVNALNQLLAQDVSGYGRTQQSELDALTEQIIAATDSLTEAAANIYNITFKWNTASGEQSETVTASEGSVPVPPSGAEASYTANDYTYTFESWSPAIVAASADTVYTAVYGTPVFNPADYSKVDAAVSAAQAKQAEADYDAKYTAASRQALADAVSAVETGKGASQQAVVDGYADAINAAINALAIQTYTVTFNYKTETGADTSDTQTLEYGVTPVAPSVQNYSDNTYNYTFNDWDKTVAAVTADTVYTAQYNKSYITYTITFSWHEGSTTVDCHYGDVPEAPSVPGYSEGGKTYSFIGWTPTLVACTGNASYTAQYSSEDIYYTITWVVNGKTTTDTVKAGDTPMAPSVDDYSDGDYDYTFTAWNPAVVPASGNAEYTAEFEATFVTADYSTVESEIAAAQAVISADGYTVNYTEASRKALADAIAAVEENLGRTQQTKVDGFAAAIKNARESLVLNGADYTAYNNAVQALQAELAKTDVYTPTSVTAVTAALENIDSTLNKDLNILSQSVVDEAEASVEALANQLVLQADKTELKAKYAEAETEAAKDCYTPETLAVLTQAMETALAVINDGNASAEDVSAQITALDNAIRGLAMKADKNALASLIEQANAMSDAVYKDLTAVKSAVAEAQAVYDDPNASTEDVTNVMTALQAAMDAAEKYPADYSAYNAAVTAIEAELAEVDVYTPDSIRAVTAALAEIKNSLSADLKIDEQSVVDEAKAAVDALKSNLVLRADLTELQNALDRADKYDTSSFKPSSVTKFKAAVQAVKDKVAALTGNETQDDILLLENELTAAYALLETQVSCQPVVDAIAALKAADTSKYTEASVAEYNAAVADAEKELEALAADGDRTEAEVAALLEKVNKIPDLLVFSGADYSEFEQCKKEFAALDKTLYTDSSLKAVEDAIAEVKELQDINYQDELDTLVANIKTALSNLEYLCAWAGETDWEGIDHEYFYADLKFVQVIDEENPSDVKIEVYLNHPVNDVYAFQLAALFDGNKMIFNNAVAANGEVIYAAAAQAQFDADEYGLNPMGKTSIAKVSVSYDTPIAKAVGERHLLMTLNFTAVSSDSSYIANVPLASNIYADKSNYTAIMDLSGTDYTESYVHCDPVAISLSGEPLAVGSVSGTLNPQNTVRSIVVTLTDESGNSYSATVNGKTAYSIADVPAGTYTLTVTSGGSLGYTVNNVVVTAGEDTEIDDIRLLYGDVNENGCIDIQDVTIVLNAGNYGSIVSDVNFADATGDGVVDAKDISLIIGNENYGITAATQVREGK